MNFKNLSFEEKEMAILRAAVDKNQQYIGKRKIGNPENY